MIGAACHIWFQRFIKDFERDNLFKCWTLSRRWWSIWSRPGGDVSMGSALSEVDMWKECLLSETTTREEGPLMLSS